ncbi:MAG TPA: SURF1 family protein [Ramlibacter sp.]|uniref:SURF1 family protein n=1 Tax=Ramlibacter sp. TaxID=1917967 RepID=UPI002D5711A7|nr:SURF1 family protein [Ramlibacter sp.]HZY19391.1 SURF1 family protein [Ramlibacter sp.]
MPRPRSTVLVAVLVVLAALACAGFVALGVWQLQRLAWKESLVARIERQLKADPVPSPGPVQWSALSREADEYRRLRLQGRFAHDRQVLVRASTELGAGYWVLTPMQLREGAWVLVNRGFVPPELRDRVPRGEEVQLLTGLLRFSEPGGSLLQANDPAQGRWYSRDVAAIAAAQRLAGPVAPYFVDAERTAATTVDTWPRPGLTVLRFSNNHLGYAATWFALAAIMAGALGYLVVDERRQRRLAGAPPLVDRQP